MDLKVGRTYRVVDNTKADFCNMCDDCNILVMMERGFIPGNIFTIVHKLGGNLIVEFEGGDRFGVREKHLSSCEFIEYIY